MAWAWTVTMATGVYYSWAWSVQRHGVFDE